MKRLVERFFGAFEGTCNPYPLAAFRIVFYSGLALHFFPSIFCWNDNFSREALRKANWNSWLFSLVDRVPQGFLQFIAALTVLGCIAGLVGFRPRLAAIVSGLGLYAFASFNSFNVQTLAISSAWAVLWIWAVTGGGSEALSVDRLLRPGIAKEGPKLPRYLILTHILLGFFFAGIEKVVAGWPFQNEMGFLLRTPQGFILRDWSAHYLSAFSEPVGMFIGIMTLLIELVLPVLVPFVIIRWPMLLLYWGFFAGIFLVLQVPPLFGAIFGGAGFLMLDDKEVIERFLQRSISKELSPERQTGAGPI